MFPWYFDYISWHYIRAQVHISSRTLFHHISFIVAMEISMQKSFLSSSWRIYCFSSYFHIFLPHVKYGLFCSLLWCCLQNAAVHYLYKIVLLYVSHSVGYSLFFHYSLEWKSYALFRFSRYFLFPWV